MLDFEKIEKTSKIKFTRDPGKINELLHKALQLEKLTLEDIAYLLFLERIEDIERLCNVAYEIKQKVFGKRIVLFAPLYLSNECSNKCLYCGFQYDNKEEKRKTLQVEEAIEEASFLTKRGFRRALLVTAENKQKCGLDYILSVVEGIYKNTHMEILHLNAAPMEVEELNKLREAGIGVFQVFQETYHRKTYELYHVGGKKRDFDYRLSCMNRAFEAGFKDVGIGCLLGLYDYKFDVLATIEHARFLEKIYGSYPHTISVPRLRYARGAVLKSTPYPVDDLTFKKIVAIYRIAIPSTGIVISTREPSFLRDEVLFCGASQISAESSTAPGGYTGIVSSDDGAQFSLNDTRSLEDVIIAILERGMWPSFCTACYRKGREGGFFHELASSGQIKTFCEENAINTFVNYVKNMSQNNKKEQILQLFLSLREKEVNS